VKVVDSEYTGRITAANMEEREESGGAA